MAEREGTPEDFARLFGAAREARQDVEPQAESEQVQAEEERDITEAELIAALTAPPPWAKALVDQAHPPEGEG